MQKFLGQLFFYLCPVQAFTVHLHRLNDFFDPFLNRLLLFFFTEMGPFADEYFGLTFQEFKPEVFIKKFLKIFNKHMPNLRAALINLQNYMYPSVVKAFFQFIHMDVNTFFKSSLPFDFSDLFDFSELADVVADFFHFLNEDLAISLLSVQESSKPFIAHLDKVLEFLKKKNFYYFFTDDMSISLDELSFFIPAFKNMSVHLKSLRSVFTFLDAFRSKYLIDFKELERTFNYLLLVVERLFLLINDIDNTKKNLLESFQQ